MTTITDNAAAADDDGRRTAALQILRLKGRVSPAALAASLGLSDAEAGAILDALVVAGAVTTANGTANAPLRLTPDGRKELADRVAEERRGIDRDALHRLYDVFHPVNSAFKELVAAWQTRDGVPNDHGDAAYDDGIRRRLAAIDGDLAPLLDGMTALAPRLSPYPARFANALGKVMDGDHAWFARPILDSYHTVWFELHEDLIGLLGLSREAEAIAGRAE